MKLPRLYPPIWFLVFAGAALGLGQTTPWRVELSAITAPLALVVAALGAGLGVWARYLFLRARTTAHPHREARMLLTHGVYRITRNPMYLGLLLMLTALVIWQQNLVAVLLPPLFVALLNRQHIVPEERRLARQFGQRYQQYRRRTRRWL